MGELLLSPAALADMSRKQRPNVSVVEAEPYDLAIIAYHMRERDVDECAAMSGLSPRDAVSMLRGLSHEVWAGRVDDRPVCVFGLGVGSIAGGLARPWMLGTEELERHAFAFLRRNRSVVERWSRDYRLLENWVDVRNVSSQRWLRWLGFTLDAPAPFGPFGYDFRRFEMRNEPCASPLSQPLPL